MDANLGDALSGLLLARRQDRLGLGPIAQRALDGPMARWAWDGPTDSGWPNSLMCSELHRQLNALRWTNEQRLIVVLGWAQQT